MERTADVNARVGTALAHLRTIRADVPAFNELLRRLGLRAIVLPAKPVT
jgi:hypothetical protein